MTNNTTNNDIATHTPNDLAGSAGAARRRQDRLREGDPLRRRVQHVSAGAAASARHAALCASCGRWHADDADRQPRSRGGQRLEPGARDGQRSLIGRSDNRAIGSILMTAQAGAGGRHRQHCVDRLGIARLAQLARGVGVTQHTRDPGQRLEVIGAGAFRRQQQEDETDRLAVERFEIDRPLQPRKQSEQLVRASAACRAVSRRRCRLRWSRASRAASMFRRSSSRCDRKSAPPWRQAPAAPASCR